MPFDFPRARECLKQNDLKRLFVEELGWEPLRHSLSLRVKERDYALTGLAEKRGFAVWVCLSPEGGLPDHPTRLALHRKLVETSYEHIIVFATADHARQIWMWVRREPGKPLAARTHEYHCGQPGDSLLQKLQGLYISLEEEEKGELNVLELSGRVRASFDLEKVTKKFYKEFDAHRQAFLKFIEGIPEKADREWYASVMLNRLMFVYFIQKKGFLDGDPDYLRNRLARCRADHGKDKFYSFYRVFLLRLFHEGLGNAKREPALAKLLGRIPYLNGGLFDVHELEKPTRYGKTIEIPDQAFEKIFAYFDEYQWHLDERPLRADDEINPDVLGYIFEKYINQKQMGAYYTKEDITEYIGKNTLIPFLFDSARKACKVAFDGSAGVSPALPPSSKPSGQDARALFLHQDAPIEVSQHLLPHWNQANCLCSITFRLDDAMPAEKLAEWKAEREVWVSRHPEPWDEATEAEYHRLFSDRLDEWLDAGHGCCILRDPAVRKIVADALHHFDGERYGLLSYAIMPNHVHVLVKLKDGHPLKQLLHSWKSFTAKLINAKLGKTGAVWQIEYWDRLIRNQKHLIRCLAYIRENPIKAGLREGEFSLFDGSAGVPPALPSSTKPSGQDARAPVHSPTIWDHLASDPDRYIYPAVRHGVDQPLPADIAAGLNPPGLREPVPAGATPDDIPTLRLRKAWNKPAPDTHALPTETWREHIHRRQRCEELRRKLAAGEVRDINDLITLNLDIRQFAEDVISRCEGPDLLRAVWKAVEKVTVLDPTCGSGAFLFAALNLLEPLYEACLDRMETFLEDEAAKHPADKLKRTAHGIPLLPHKKFEDFSIILDRVAAHPNPRYFIFKSIILNNLYGVDIMEEAVEICKLRLFLKLAAQVEADPTKDNLGIEPLPDIDFNIRAGNTLVGYATEAEVRRCMQEFGGGQMKLLDDDELNSFARFNTRCADVQQAFDAFRKHQTEGDGSVPVADKLELQKRLKALEDELNHHLAGEYGIKGSAGVPPALSSTAKPGGQDARAPVAYEKWLKSHQPFHWFVQFYGIIQNGGFDVIIGNPPYVSATEVSYLPKEMKEMKFPDIYAHVLLRSLTLSPKTGRCGMIVPLSVTFSSDFGLLRGLLCSAGLAWFSSYDNIPAAIFDGVSQRCTIWLGGKGECRVFTTPMYRWRSAFRPHLVGSISCVPLAADHNVTDGLPKLYSEKSSKVLKAIHSPPVRQQRHLLAAGNDGRHQVGFSAAARNFISVFVDEPPCLDERTLNDAPSLQIGGVSCSSDHEANSALVALAGNLYFFYWLIRGDGFHVTSLITKKFLRCLDFLPPREFNFLVILGEFLHERRFECLVFKKNAGKYVGNFNYQNQFSITRRADLLIMAGLGLGREEAVDVFDRVQRVLAINESAGEKNIPEAVKAKYPPSKFDTNKQAKLFGEIDTVLAHHYGFTAEELDFIVNYDIKYRMGRDAGGEEE
jgi:REP element-mobilizing transposase RayT